VSTGWGDLIGINPEEAQEDPESTFERIVPEDLPEVERTIALSATTLEPWRCEFRIQAEDEVKWIYGSSAPEQQEDGILWSGVLTDITAQKAAEVEREHLQQEIIEAQKQALHELSTPVIPIMNAPDGGGGIIAMTLIGSIDSMRARDITRSLLAGISQHQAKVVILDVTGVPLVDSGVANHLNKTIQAARLKGAQTIVTGISDAVAETIVDLGIDWGEITTLSDLQTGLVVALESLGIKLSR
jgi:rsbT co-antagonist protein RsbR